MRIAIACRVSSDMQAETGWSLDDQERRGRAWIEREGHTLARLYRQEGISAGTADRDEIIEIMADAKSNAWDGLWIWNVTRFTRHSDDLRHLRSIEFDCGKRIFEDGRAITTLTPSGELDVSLRVIVGSYELAKIRQETSRGKRARAMAGKSNSSIAPTGYDHHDGQLVPRGDNAQAVTLIFQLFCTGAYSIRQVAEIIQSRGYKTNAGNPFSVDTVTAILRNKTYAGFAPYRGLTPIYTQADRPRNSKRDVQWYPAAHQPLVDVEVWDKCQAVRIKRSGVRYGRSIKPHRTYLLRHIARCAGCGRPMRAHASIYEKAKYRCGARDRGVPCSQQRCVIRESALEPQIDAFMTSLVWSDAIKRRALEMATHADAARDVLADRKRIQAQLERAKSLYEMADYTLEQYTQRKADLAAKLAALQVPDVTDAAAALDMLNDAAAMWAGATRQERQEILAVLFDSIVVDMDAERITEWHLKTKFAALVNAANAQPC